MTDKQNALRVIGFNQPERVMTGVPQQVVCYFGCNHEDFDGRGHEVPVGSQWTDIWGVGWRKEHAEVMGFPVEYPLADLPAALATYRWPDPDDERLRKPLTGIVRDPEKFLTGSHRDTLWERCYMLVGMENAMCNFVAEPAAMRAALHRIMDFQLGIARHYLALGVEMVNLSDDLGMQCGPIMDPAMIREFFLPEYRRLFDLYRPQGVLVNFHSCGHIEPVLDMFLELGVNILNPLQATANDLAAVRRRTQGRIALWGGLSSALVMAGPVERIRDEVRQRMGELGRDGGYFCTADQWMPFPEAHLEAYRQAVAEFGRYPLPELI